MENGLPGRHQEPSRLVKRHIYSKGWVKRQRLRRGHGGATRGNRGQNRVDSVGGVRRGFGDGGVGGGGDNMKQDRVSSIHPKHRGPLWLIPDVFKGRGEGLRSGAQARVGTLWGSADIPQDMDPRIVSAQLQGSREDHESAGMD